MFVQYEVGDRVFHKILREEGKVVMVKRNFCVVHIEKEDGGVLEVSPHFHDIVKITDDDVNNESKSKFEQVRDFHLAFKHPAPDRPIIMDFDTAYNRSKWVIEEVIEHLHATDDKQLSASKHQLMADVGNMVEKELGKPDAPETSEEKLIAQADALIDQLYFVYGSLVVQGINPDKLFEIVNSYNMDKLEDGKIVYKDEGKTKIGKRKGWLPPDEELKAEIRRQIKEAEGNA